MCPQSEQQAFNIKIHKPQRETIMRQIRVLCVQAQENDFLQLRQTLQQSEIDFDGIDWANSYEAGLDSVISEQHDIYLLDATLGEDSGLDLVRKAISCGYQASFILLFDTQPTVEQVTEVRLTGDIVECLEKSELNNREFGKIIDYLLRLADKNAALQTIEQRYQHILSNIDQFVYLKDLPNANHAHGRINFISNRVFDITGYTADELLQDPCLWELMTHPDDKGWMQDLNWYAEQLLDRKASIDSQSIVHEIRIRPKKANQYIWLRHEVFPRFNTKLQLDGFMGAVRDISQQKASDDQLKFDALHDALTGLPNRTLLLDRLNNAIQRAKRRNDYQFAVLFVDLDRFKNINDVMGHLAGDRFLTGIAERLAGFLRPADTVARLGGDEFAILLEDIAYAHDATFVADRLQDLISKPITINSSEVYTTASVGVVLSTGHYNAPEEMLRDADTAMYKAKTDGKARYELFDSDMHAKAVASLQLETDLRNAIDNDQLSVCYQPIVSLQDGRICAFEVLIRWQHPQQGIIMPEQLIPMADETGLIVPIGYWVLKTACEQMRYWQQQFANCPLDYVSVNLSARQFVEMDLIERIDQTVIAAGIEPQYLNLEITESVVIETPECINAMLAQFKSMNIRVSMDDFGTGYSSLSHLHDLSFDTLKIDRSFISAIDNSNDKHTEIVKSLINLAHNLGLKVIAEGVETEKQVLELERMGCDLAQGYYYSPPISDREVEAMLRLQGPAIQSISQTD